MVLGTGGHEEAPSGQVSSITVPFLFLLFLLLLLFFPSIVSDFGISHELRNLGLLSVSSNQ